MTAIEHIAFADAAAQNEHVEHNQHNQPAVLTDVVTPALPGMPALAEQAASNDAARPAAQAGSVASELFGSFFLGQDEFALPAICIREVVNYPDKVTPMPLSPHFLEGVFTLRGTVIPVLNLARIFDPAAGPAAASHKIAIVDHKQIQVGLVFHDTGEILRVRAEQKTNLQYRDGGSLNVVGGTIRLDDGARLLQILDPAALISIENVPQVLALRSTSRKAETSQFHLQAERRQCVAFRVGGTAFAFEMSAIREIIDVPELKSSVLNSKLCLGRINLRGNAVAVVDFARLLNMDHGGASANGGGTHEARPGSAQRIVIARIGDASIGLLVDSVDNIFSFFPGDALPIPLLSKTRAGMFGGCIHKEEMGAIIYLNHQHIFSTAEVQDITRGHAELYQQENTASVAHRKVSASNERKVYITFTVGNTYALEIRKIREIIDFPETMITPPSMPSFVEGILNLRRQMITVLNLRCLYGMPPSPDKSTSKILVVERGEERFGLMVDAVENIVTIANTDRIPTPRLLRGSDHSELRNEMQEVIELSGADQSHQTISVFEIERFLERLAREMTAA